MIHGRPSHYFKKENTWLSYLVILSFFYSYCSLLNIYVYVCVFCAKEDYIKIYNDIFLNTEKQKMLPRMLLVF